MKTKFVNTESAKPKWYIIDAANKPLGRIATQAATLLRGKHKPDFTPNAVTGDYVIIINSDKIILTGNKLDQKKIFSHSGYIGNEKFTSYREVMKKSSDLAMKRAVNGMLPKNKLRDVMIKRLHVYKDEEHKHEAQKPKVYEVKGE